MSIAKRPYLTKCHAGRYLSVAAGVDRCDHVQTVLECAPMSMRIGIVNALAVQLTGIKVAIAAANAIGADNAAVTIDPTAAGGTWLPVPFAGSTSGATIAAGNTQNTVDNPNITWSDWRDITALDASDAGGLFPLHVRIESPAANANLPVFWANGSASAEAGWETAANVAGRIWRARSQNVLGVGDKTLFTSTTFNGQTIAFVIQYVPRDAVRGFTYGVLGDSTREGTGATVHNFGAAPRAQALVSTPATPVEICNMAINGASSSRNPLRAQNMLSQIRPEVAEIPVYTVNGAGGGLSNPNNPITDTEIAGMRHNFNLSRIYASDADVFVIASTGLPSNPAAKDFNASDSKRTAINASFVDVRSSKMLTLDLATPFSGAIDGDGQIGIGAGLTNDNIHPNDAGYTTLAWSVAHTMRRVLAVC